MSRLIARYAHHELIQSVIVMCGLVPLGVTWRKPSDVGLFPFTSLRLGPARTYGTRPGRLSWRPLSFHHVVIRIGRQPLSLAIFRVARRWRNLIRDSILVDQLEAAL